VDAAAPRVVTPEAAAPATSVAPSTPAAPVAPISAAPVAPSSIDRPVASSPVIEPVAPASQARTAAAASTPPATPQLSRRARRAQTGEQPVIAVPPIAPAAPEEPMRPTAAFAAEPASRAEPAPLRDTVLAPVEPFELLAPAVEPETASAAQGWMAETLAKLMAAEVAAAPAPVPAVVEQEVPQQAVPRPEPVHAPEPVRVAEPVRAPETVAPEPQPSPAPRPATTAQPTAERPPTERIEPLTGPIPAPGAPGVDEFEAAARLFSFTAETPTQRAAAVEEDPEAEAPTVHTAPRRVQARRGSAFRRVATASFSIGVFGVVGLIAVGMTTPVEAVAAMNGTDATLSVLAPGDVAGDLDASEIQAYVAPGDAQSDPLDRTENYATTTTAQLASEAGIRNFSNLFHNDPNSNIQWPFAVGVTMSYGFGMRSGRMHEGIDFTPGAGSPVQAVADGTVRIASESGGAYGVHVVIDHIVDGELVSSHYAHMQYGSLQVVAGQHVTVGTVIGHTGNTGRSFGAHTHFEIWKNGTTPIDPWPWLQEYTDGTHTVG